MELTYIKGESKSLRELGYDEKWLHKKITDDPSVLGLGELTVKGHERSQPSGGRIDFLMCNEEEDVWYEIEIMLGALDESHIIRSIEYWDIERTRYPQLEHRAVIVAEEITSRFFNIISLLNRAVPIIAIQLEAIRVEDKLILNFTKVLDISDLREPEPSPSGVDPVDPKYWEKRTNPESFGIVTKVADLIPPEMRKLSYNREHVALGTSGFQFAWFYPRKASSHCVVELRMRGDGVADWVTKLTERGIRAKPQGKNLKLFLTQRELLDNEQLIRDLLLKCEELAR